MAAAAALTGRITDVRRLKAEMEPFIVLEGVAAPLDQSNVDTGLILPARFLRRPSKGGYRDFLFRDLRFRQDGSEIADFVLNQPPFRKASILVGDRNFGSGSSREQASWGLVDYGIRCVIAADFGDIFRANAFKSGLLPVQLDIRLCRALRSQLLAHPGATIRVDLAEQTVTGSRRRSPSASRSTLSARDACSKGWTTSVSRCSTTPRSVPSSRPTGDGSTGSSAALIYTSDAPLHSEQLERSIPCPT